MAKSNELSNDFQQRDIPCPHIGDETTWSNPTIEIITIENSISNHTSLLLCEACYGVITGHVLRDVLENSVKEIAEKVANENLGRVLKRSIYGGL